MQKNSYKNMIIIGNKMSWKPSEYMGFACFIKFCKAPKPLPLLDMINHEKNMLKKHEKKCLTFKFLLHTIENVVGMNREAKPKPQ